MSSNFEAKMLEAFGEEVIVEKGFHTDLRAWRIPRFIEEYLISKLCSNEEENCLEKIYNFLKVFRPSPEEKDLFLDKVIRKGEIRLLDFYRAKVDLKRRIYKLEIPVLDIHSAVVNKSVIKNYKKLLTYGVWGIGTIRYLGSKKEKKKDIDPLMLTDLVPYEVTEVSLDEFKERRRLFTEEEWIDLLILSIGLNPYKYSSEEKLILISRLLPLVEPNLNIVELGPRATGKTFLYRNISPLVRVISGGVVSPATLFYNMRRKTMGLIGVMDVVVFDEIHYVRFSSVNEIRGKLKDYMASGHFERGKKQATSGCSLVFLGNLDTADTDPTDIFSDLPLFSEDPALVDRIHGMIPGWRIPKVTTKHLGSGKALALDYLGAIMHELRKLDMTEKARELYKIEGSPSIRDEQAIYRLLSGMLKLLYPNGKIEGENIILISSLVEEMRGFIREWLSSMLPEEYKEYVKVKVR
ncbi:MAG TPA: BREX system Lon protease-like protein BrxL [Thermofilum sp.]|nr:BREX system Lon protease-like protein BrxL [Thermofilum sp.]